MKVRRMSITVKLMLMISTISIISTLLLGIFTYKKESMNLMEMTKTNTMDIASCAANSIDADVFRQISEGMEESEQYSIVNNTLSIFRDNNSSIEFVYTMKMLSDGRLVFIVDADKDEPAAIYEEYELLEGMKGALGGHRSVDNEVTTDEWGSYISAYAPIISTDGEIVGIVGADTSVNWIEEQLSQVRRIIIIISICIIFGSLICAFVISRRIGSHIRNLNREIMNINSGDGDLTKTVNIRSGDEFEVISENINTFINGVRELVRQVVGSADTVNINGKLLLAAVEKNMSSTSEIDISIDTLSANMEECAASNDTVMGNLEGTIREMEKLAAKTNEIKDYTDEIREKANKVIVEAKQSSHEASEKILNMRKRVEEANINAGKISLVLDMAKKIQRIASQTQTLALNARIEAARAGESGRGFTVVAEQVSSLSKEIGNTVTEISNASQEVVTAVDILINETTEMNRYIDSNVMKDYEKLVNIGEQYSETANRINDEMILLDGESENVNSNIESISGNMRELDRAVNDSAKHIESLNELSEGIITTMKELSKLADRNLTESNELKSQVTKYQY